MLSFNASTLPFLMHVARLESILCLMATLPALSHIFDSVPYPRQHLKLTYPLHNKCCTGKLWCDCVDVDAYL